MWETKGFRKIGFSPSIQSYSDQELLERGDEISLIMLINKIQDLADLERFLRIPSEELNQIIRHSPEHVVDVLVLAIESLCFKIDVSAEDRKRCVQKVRTREMGYLFENMERISVREMQQKLEEERQKSEEERQKSEEERQKSEEELKETKERLKIAEERIRHLEKMARV